MADPLKLDALTRLAIRSATATLIDGGSLSVWEKAMQQALTRGHTAATLAGLAERLGVPLDSALLSERRLSKREREDIKKVLKEQFGYLGGFKEEIDAGRLSDAQVRARAEMYGAAVRLTYQEARWGDWDIPDDLIPGNASPCMSNCRCTISVEDNGDGTGVLIRKLGASEHSCSACPDLAGEYPVQRRAA